ncbi:hypothetical protein PIB30_065388 [Stylosanthes scabra]|uniref:Uncharacterized protein n=1 Tax=Stylosanthes scabra TaxID=79078 RepID=A0ABU6SN09_9FABA|nr:hypothetical protein [Stylosanthes scabra]
MDMAMLGVEKNMVDLYVVHNALVPNDFCYAIGYLDVGSGNKDVEADIGASNVQRVQIVETQLDGLVDVQVNAEGGVQNGGDEDDDPDYEMDSDLHFSDSEDDFYRDNSLFDVNVNLREMQEEILQTMKTKAEVDKLKKKKKEGSC